MELKYNEDIKRISKEGFECPPSGIYGIDGTFYRFGHLDRCAGFDNNNLPVKKINPERILINEDKVKCVASASLSCFETLDSIRVRFSKLKLVSKNMRKSIGCSIFKYNVEAKDGLRTKTDSSGHFSFFESEDVDLSEKSVFVESLVECES